MATTQHAMIFDYPGGRFISLAADIECFEVEHFVTGAGAPIELDRCLDMSASVDSVSRRLLIAPPANRLMTTTATLHVEEIDSSRFFVLPWLLRRADCAEWVRGVVAPCEQQERLALWIDLRELARAVTR